MRPSGRGIAQDSAMKGLTPAAQALTLKLEEIETQPDAKGLESAFQTGKRKQVNAIMTLTTHPLFRRKRKRIVELAAKYRLPAIFTHIIFVEDGGLMCYGVEFY